MSINLYQRDCLEAMKEMPDNSYELAIVDPPYGIKASKMTMGSGKHKFKKNKNWDNEIPSPNYFKELFRISKNQIIWGGNYFTDFLPPSKNWLVWNKKNPNLSFAEGELAWVRDGKLLRIFNWYSARVENGGKIHPTQKPVRLYEWLLDNYAKEGGSIALACHNRGYSLDAYEIDEEYYNAAADRLRIHQSQLTIF